MRRFNFLLLDEYVRSTVDALSSDAYMEALGRCDLLAFQAIVSEPDAPGFLHITPQHSGDGRLFVARNTTFVGAFTSGVTSMSDYDSANLVGLSYVRFRLQVTTATTAHVKLYVTCRDPSPHTIL